MKCQETRPEIASLYLNLEIEINVEDPLPTNNDSLNKTSTEETITTESKQNFEVAAVEAEIENEYEDADADIDREARETMFFNSTDSDIPLALSIRNETTLTTISDFKILNIPCLVTFHAANNKFLCSHDQKKDIESF